MYRDGYQCTREEELAIMSIKELNGQLGLTMINLMTLYGKLSYFFFCGGVY